MNNNIGWLSSSTWAILLASQAIYSCIPLKAIQYYINIFVQLLDEFKAYAEKRPEYATLFQTYHEMKNKAEMDNGRKKED